MSDTPMTSQSKIAELVRAGQLSPEDARTLEKALPGAVRPAPRWRRFIDPWERASERVQLAVAVATALGSAALALLGGVRFDGALDLHLGSGRVGLATAAVDQGVAWLLTAALFWLLARAFRARPRLIDMVMTTGAARAPLLLSGLFLMAVPLPRDPNQLLATAPGVLVAVALVVIPLSIWFLVLLYTGWRHATGLRAPRAGVGFGLGVLLAEVLSKLALTLGR